MFRSWAGALPASVEVCPVQLPGRAGRLREEPFSHLEPLIDAAHEALAPYFDIPFAFFGHSMGAIVAFELARALRRSGGPEPAHLYVAGRRPPHHEDPGRTTFDLPQDEFVEELKRLNGTPKEVLEHPELLELLIPLLRADFAVCETYQYVPEPPLLCPITAFGGLTDADGPRETLDEWRVHTTGPFAVRMFAGDHFFIDTHREDLLRVLHQSLHQLVASSGSAAR